MLAGTDTLRFLSGPNWIHGTTNNPILNLARGTNTPLCPATEDTLVYDQTGILLDNKKVEECHEIVWNIISDAFRFSNQNSLQISPDTSLKDFFIEKLSEMELSHEDCSLLLQMGEMWGSFIGDSWEKQSLKYFWLEECLDGGM